MTPLAGCASGREGALCAPEKASCFNRPGARDGGRAVIRRDPVADGRRARPEDLHRAASDAAAVRHGVF
ncbi:hypothetical protein [Pseudoxanthobacter soli]|uniref:hypothetical protein n=1 Tax=Pseudoxanthobacter soli TaxID=433840 RepID=UPI0009376373|nr:hypothetical protein [Pseudoxanthobacter soli]